MARWREEGQVQEALLVEEEVVASQSSGEYKAALQVQARVFAASSRLCPAPSPVSRRPHSFFLAVLFCFGNK